MGKLTVLNKNKITYLELGGLNNDYCRSSIDTDSESRVVHAIIRRCFDDRSQEAGFKVPRRNRRRWRAGFRRRSLVDP